MKQLLHKNFWKQDCFLFLLSALPLKLLEWWLNTGSPKENHHEFDHKRTLQTTSVLRGNVMEVKVHTRESYPDWQVLFWT